MLSWLQGRGTTELHTSSFFFFGGDSSREVSFSAGGGPTTASRSARSAFIWLASCAARCLPRTASARARVRASSARSVHPVPANDSVRATPSALSDNIR